MDDADVCSRSVHDLLPDETPDETHKAIVDYDDPRWEEILDALWEEDALNLINYGAYRTMGIEYIDLPATLHGDGPAGFTSFMNRVQVNGTCQFVFEPVMAATWNVELMEELGNKMGDAVILRKAAKNILYSFVNSNAMNAAVVGYMQPLWVEYLYIIDAVLAGLLLLWGVAATISSVRRSRRMKAE